MKRCTKCGKEKPLDEFNRDRTRKDGHHPWCKPCGHERRNAWYRENRDTNLAYQAAWREKNKKRKAAGDRAWREANLERKTENDRRWRQANKERLDATHAAWRAENTVKISDYRRNRRARKTGNFVSRVYFTTIVQRDLGICGICGKQVMEETAELDHIVPLAAGGTHEPSNVQLAHRACNRRKAAKVNFTLAA